MIKNNKISEFLDQYSIELRRIGIYLLIITFIFGLSLKVIGDRTKVAPPENRQAENSYIEVDLPDPQIPEGITVIVEPSEDAPGSIVNEDIIETSEQKPIEPKQEADEAVLEEGVDIQEQPEVITEEEEVAEDATKSSEVINEETEVPVPALAESVAFSWPLQGDIINPHGLTYSKTFGDYRFNPGIDIAAAQGAEVKAALEGKVLKVETNQREKTIIEIEHIPGVISRYSHLEQSLVKSGDTVGTGQVIGKVGSPGLEKSAEEPLLHFQIKNGDKNVDPTKYIK